MPHARTLSFPWSGPAAGWPVWMLCLAWLCANSPPELTCSLATWAQNARSFSHQERLREEVFFLLAGRKAAPATPAVAAKPAPARPMVPPIVGQSVLKKIHFYPALSVRILPPEPRDWRYGDRLELQPDPIRTEPPVPPPRRVTA